MDTEANVDIEGKIDEFMAEIEKTEREIVDASEESRKLLALIFEYNAKLQEARYLSNSYKGLRSQYKSDIKRLAFIVDGDAKGKQIRQKPNCPFCGHDMDEEEDVRTSYVDSAKAELARIRLQLEDLEKTEVDTSREITILEERLKELNDQNSRITQLLNRKLRPHVAELRAAVAEYKRMDLMDLVKEMSTEEQRYVREGFSSDEELSIYDLLFSDSLSKSDIQKIKHLSVDLLKKIKERIAQMDHWTDKDETRATVQNLIRDELYMNIPDSMFDQLDHYREVIYEYVYTHYKEAA